MKLASTIFVLVCLSVGCRDNALSEKNLTHITVVRNADKQTVTTIPTETPARVDNYPVVTMPEPAPRATYHIIVASYKAADKAKAERLVARLREKDYPASLLYSSQRYRVSIESFTSESEANSARDEYRTTTDRQDIWVHKVNH